MTIRIQVDDYEYSNDSLEDSEPVFMMPFYVLAAKHLQALDKEWGAMVKEGKEAGSDLQYGETAYPTKILLEMDGAPIGYIGYVDDIVQFVPFKQKRIET